MVDPPPGQPVPPRRLGLVAGFVLLVATGYVDAYTFLRHGHVFAEAMTGNLVLIGIGAFDSTVVPFWRPLASVAAYLLGAFVVAQATRTVRTRSAAPQLATLAVNVFVLAAAGLLSRSFPQPLITTSIAFAAGLQSAAFSRIDAAEASTVVMTMNSTHAAAALLAALESRDLAAMRQARALIVALVGFVAGIFLGGWLSRTIGDRASLVDAAIFVVAAAVFYEHDRRGRLSGAVRGCSDAL